jgi:HSP20 family molecular chaperone IbpA
VSLSRFSSLSGILLIIWSRSGSFSRVVAVTEPVREESVVINLDKGVLEIFIPKAGAVAEGKKRVD